MNMENQKICKNCEADLVISEHLGKLEGGKVSIEGRCTWCDGFIQYIDPLTSRLVKHLEADPITSALWRLLK